MPDPPFSSAAFPWLTSSRLISIRLSFLERTSRNFPLVISLDSSSPSWYARSSSFLTSSRRAFGVKEDSPCMLFRSSVSNPRFHSLSNAFTFPQNWLTSSFCGCRTLAVLFGRLETEFLVVGVLKGEFCAINSVTPGILSGHRSGELRSRILSRENSSPVSELSLACTKVLSV